MRPSVGCLCGLMFVCGVRTSIRTRSTTKATRTGCSTAKVRALVATRAFAGDRQDCSLDICVAEGAESMFCHFYRERPAQFDSHGDQTRATHFETVGSLRTVRTQAEDLASCFCTQLCEDVDKLELAATAALADHKHPEAVRFMSEVRSILLVAFVLCCWALCGRCSSVCCAPCCPRCAQLREDVLPQLEDDRKVLAFAQGLLRRLILPLPVCLMV